MELVTNWKVVGIVKLTNTKMKVAARYDLRNEILPITLVKSLLPEPVSNDFFNSVDAGREVPGKAFWNFDEGRAPQSGFLIKQITKLIFIGLFHMTQLTLRADLRYIRTSISA